MTARRSTGDFAAVVPAFEGRLRTGRLAFRLELEIAQNGDPVDDPSALWPAGRARVVVGRLELFRPITHEEIGDPVMMHDPTAVTDGIEVSPDDQMIAPRRGASPRLRSIHEYLRRAKRRTHLDGTG